jgi:hypothetical protein
MRDDLDVLYQEVLRAGENRQALRAILAERAPSDNMVIALLRRAVPRSLLELLGSTAPWSERPGVMAVVALNPKTPQGLALRLLPILYWRDLALIAANLWLMGPVRLLAEGLLKERMSELRPGDRIELAKLATANLVNILVTDADARVVRAALLNPHLRESDLLIALRRETIRPVLITEALECFRWRANYNVRMTLASQTRIPQSVVLSLLTGLRAIDLRRISAAATATPLVRAAALRVLEERADQKRADPMRRDCRPRGPLSKV